jgi:UDPglucose 6-dehydrogenase
MDITIVGTGYVGLVTGACLADLGHRVVCVDIDEQRVEAIRRAEPLFHEPGLPELVRRGVDSGRLRAQTDLPTAVAGSDVTILAVGTPSANGPIDLTALLSAAEQVGQALRFHPGYPVVAVKSTVVPGTTDSIVRRTLEAASGRKVGDFGLCVNPEFLREGSAVADFLAPDRLVIGQCDERAGLLLDRVYESFDAPRVFTSLTNAELIKYTSNALLATLISFSNEIAALCESLPGADADLVMDGVHLDRRLSPSVNGARIQPGILEYLRAGCGFGGSCLPKDVNALRHYARQRGTGSGLLDAVMQINDGRPSRLVQMAESVLGTVDGAVIAVLGVAFKAGTDDIRSSPGLVVVQRLIEKGAEVRVYDSLALPGLPPHLSTRVTVCTRAEDALAGADAALITTGSPEIAAWNWTDLVARMRRFAIVDGRNTLRGVHLPAHVVYRAIGRGELDAVHEPVMGS